MKSNGKNKDKLLFIALYETCNASCDLTYTWNKIAWWQECESLGVRGVEGNGIKIFWDYKIVRELIKEHLLDLISQEACRSI